MIKVGSYHYQFMVEARMYRQGLICSTNTCSVQDGFSMQIEYDWASRCTWVAKYLDLYH